MFNIKLFGLCISLFFCQFVLGSSPFKANKVLFDQLNEDFKSYAFSIIPKDAKLNLFPNWEINYPAASAERDSDYANLRGQKVDGWDISVLGGYWREPEFGHPMVHLIVLCHELGHHLGGAPFKIDDKRKISLVKHGTTS